MVPGSLLTTSLGSPRFVLTTSTFALTKSLGCVSNSKLPPSGLLCLPWGHVGKSWDIQGSFVREQSSRISLPSGLWSWCHNLALFSTIPCVHASLQSCPTLCDAMDCSPPGSFVHGVLQVRIVDWIAMPSFRGSSWSRDPTS